MISYLIQAIVTLILGPIFIILALIFDPNVPDMYLIEIPPTHWLTKICIRLASSTHQSNALLTLSLLIACIVQLQNVAPLAVVSFIMALGSFQVIVGISGYIFSVPIMPPQLGHVGPKIVYLMASLVMMNTIFSMRKVPTSDALALEAIADFCTNQRDYSFTYADFDFWPPTKVKNLLFVAWSVSFGFLGIVCLICYLCWKRLLLVPTFLQSPYFTICRYFSLGPKKFLIILAFTLWSIIYVVGVVYFFINMEYQRQHLRKATGAAYQDNQWGFGQITTVLLWSPFVQELFCSILGMSIFPLVLP